MKTLVIGDVHGMLTELKKLLNHVGYVKGDRVICVGDLMDKGPHSVETVRFVRESGFECLLGNHEEWYIRYAKHEGKRLFTLGYVNPMKPNPVKKAIFEQLNAEDILWLKALPPFIRLGEGWLIVHGGILPGTPVEKMDVSKLIRLRWLDNDTRRFVAIDDTLKQPPNTSYWTRFYDGQEHVIFGHQPFPKVTIGYSGPGQTYALDTGCVYGDALSCLIFYGEITKSSRPDMTWVPSSRAFAEKVNDE